MHNPYDPPSARIEEGVAHRTRIRIKKFSAHQNGKVFAVLLTTTLLIFMGPVILIAGAIAPDKFAVTVLGMIVISIAYLIFGYISVVIGCWIYNMLAKFTGGIEFEMQSFEP